MKNILFSLFLCLFLGTSVLAQFKKDPILNLQNEDLKVLISDTVFQLNEDSFKLIVLQNIDTTLNKNESEAWKKLLSELISLMRKKLK